MKWSPCRPSLQDRTIAGGFPHSAYCPNRKNTALTHIVVREIAVSLNNGGLIEGPLNPSIKKSCSVRDLSRGALNWSPMMSRNTSLISPIAVAFHARLIGFYHLSPSAAGLQRSRNVSHWFNFVAKKYIQTVIAILVNLHTSNVVWIYK